MAIFRVTYSSMTARYGPIYMEAEDSYAARRKFAGSAFSQGEMGCISATEVTAEEMTRALRTAEATE